MRVATKTTAHKATNILVWLLLAKASTPCHTPSSLDPPPSALLPVAVSKRASEARNTRCISADSARRGGRSRTIWLSAVLGVILHMTFFDEQ